MAQECEICKIRARIGARKGRVVRRGAARRGAARSGQVWYGMVLEELRS
jgi:hypothetical protein